MLLCSSILCPSYKHFKHFPLNIYLFFFDFIDKFRCLRVGYLFISITDLIVDPVERTFNSTLHSRHPLPNRRPSLAMIFCQWPRLCFLVPAMSCPKQVHLQAGHAPQKINLFFPCRSLNYSTVLWPLLTPPHCFFHFYGALLFRRFFCVRIDGSSMMVCSASEMLEILTRNQNYAKIQEIFFLDCDGFNFPIFQIFELLVIINHELFSFCLSFDNLFCYNTRRMINIRFGKHLIELSFDRF